MTPFSTKSIYLSIGLVLLAACSRPEAELDRSEEFPPGQELAGSYALLPAYEEEQLQITAQGEVEYRKKGQIRRGLAYKNRFRMIIFLDDASEPSGIFMLNDRQSDRWPGSWNGEVRFIRAKAE